MTIRSEDLLTALNIRFETMTNLPSDPGSDQEPPRTLVLQGKDLVGGHEPLVAACLLSWDDSPEPTLTHGNVVIARRLGEDAVLLYDGPIIEGEDEASPDLDAEKAAAHYSAWPSLGHAKVMHLPGGAVAYGVLTHVPDSSYLKELAFAGDWRRTAKGQWLLAGVLLLRPEDEH